MRSPILLTSLTAFLAGTVSTLGINCRGSGLCPLATWDNQSPLPIMQILRDALYQAKAPDNTPYNSGDHVICVSDTLTINLTLPIIDPTGLTSGMSLGSWHLGGKIKDGGICIFPQHLKNGPLTLGMVRKLVDKLLEHGCETCGSVPIHFVDQDSNDPGDGILTFNYVRHPFCTENCLTDGLMSNHNLTMAVKPKMARRVLESVPAGTAEIPDAKEQRSLKRKAEVKMQRAMKRNAVPSPFEEDATERETNRKQKKTTRENAERKRAAGVEKRGLKDRSVRFADLAPRRNEGPRGNKGWVGWLR